MCVNKRCASFMFLKISCTNQDLNRGLGLSARKSLTIHPKVTKAFRGKQNLISRDRTKRKMAIFDLFLINIWLCFVMGSCWVQV